MGRSSVSVNSRKSWQGSRSTFERCSPLSYNCSRFRAISLVEKHRTHNAEIECSNHSWPIGVRRTACSVVLEAQKESQQATETRQFRTPTPHFQACGVVVSCCLYMAKTPVRSRPCLLEVSWSSGQRYEALDSFRISETGRHLMTPVRIRARLS